MSLEEIAREQPELVTVGPDTPLKNVAKTMGVREVEAVVVEEELEPLGIVTERDLVLDVMGRGRDYESLTASDVMRSDPPTVSTDVTSLEALQLMREAQVRRLPIVEGDRLAGFLTLEDALVHVGETIDNLASIVRAESPYYD
jgi:CBS domain-containing protein